MLEEQHAADEAPAVKAPELQSEDLEAETRPDADATVPEKAVAAEPHVSGRERSPTPIGFME